MVEDLMKVLVTFIIICLIVLLALRVLAMLIEGPVLWSVAALGLGVALWTTLSRKS